MSSQQKIMTPSAGTLGVQTHSKGASMSTEIVPSTSPFDSIRKQDATGGARWSARGLQKLLAYASWQNFQTPLERAKRSASAQGLDVADLFMRSHEKTNGRPREDWLLTKKAAYLVAMNGDPNMPQIATAQGYFAEAAEQVEKGTQLVRTPPTPQLPQNYAEALRELAATVEAKEAAELEAATNQRALDIHEGTTGTYSVRDAVKVLAQDHAIDIKEHVLRANLREWRWAYRAGGFDQPYAHTSTDRGFLALKPQQRTNRDGERVKAHPQLRITTKGITAIVRKLNRAGQAQLALVGA